VTARADRDVAVIGGTGFIGRHFLAALRREGRHARVLVRGGAAASASALASASAQGRAREQTEFAEHAQTQAALQEQARAAAQAQGWDAADITPVQGDLGDAASLARLLTPGCSVVNLAWSGVAAPDEAVRQARGLAAACRAAKVGVLLHCGTAAVFGGCDTESRVDDRTPPRPADAYGRTKLAVDDALREELDGQVPLIIVRPTSVFGRGGLGLIKLAESIARGASLASYARSCLFDRRLLHLVPVETVVQAFCFLEARANQEADAGARARCYLVSADDDPLNRFRAMEQRLMSLWGVADYRAPRVPLPSACLNLALRATGRAHSLAFTVIDGADIRALGFEPAVSLASAVADFAAWFPTRDRAHAPRDLP
jgi:nucleoside-diphosphate-sugar epimerase